MPLHRIRAERIGKHYVVRKEEWQRGGWMLSVQSEVAVQYAPATAPAPSHPIRDSEPQATILDRDCESAVQLVECTFKDPTMQSLIEEASKLQPQNEKMDSMYILKANEVMQEYLPHSTEKAKQHLR